MKENLHELMSFKKHNVPEVFRSHWFQCTCLGRSQILQRSPLVFPSCVCGIIPLFSLESERRYKGVRQCNENGGLCSMSEYTPVWFQGISPSSICPCRCQTQCWRVSAVGSRCCIIYQLMLSQESRTRRSGLPDVESEKDSRGQFYMCWTTNTKYVICSRSISQHESMGHNLKNIFKILYSSSQSWLLWTC